VSEPPRTVDAIAAGADCVRAQRDEALDLVQALLRIICGVGGYMAPEHQATVRGARALLREHGRSA
jgi:hypothetical protein